MTKELSASYRARAKALRTLADLDEFIETSDALRDVAKYYARIALAIDVMDQTGTSLKRLA